MFVSQNKMFAYFFERTFLEDLWCRILKRQVAIMRVGADRHIVHGPTPFEPRYSNRFSEDISIAVAHSGADLEKKNRSPGNEMSF